MSARPLKVLQFITELHSGGAERIVSELAAGLPARGIEVRVACLYGDDGSVGRELRARGVPVHGLSVSRWRPLEAARRLRALLKAHPCDLIHSHLHHASNAACLARVEGVPLVTTIHWVRPRKWLWRRWADRVRARFCDRVVCVSEAAARCQADGLGIPAARLKVIHNGVDLGRLQRGDRAAGRKTLGLAPDAPLLVAVGRLAAEKRHDRVIEAFTILSRRRPDARLAIVGGGPLRSALAALAKRRGLSDRVILAGHREDVPDLLAAADVAVVASDSEGFGLGAAEAMAAGRPVVAVRCDSLPEIVSDRDSGFLVEPDQPEEFAQRALALVEDKVLREAMGRRGREIAAERFAARRMVDEHAALYRELASR